MQDVPLFNDRLEGIGQGALACAAIWDGEKVIGAISTDNLLLRQPITEHECELLTLYASTLGHLCSRVRAEEQLHESNRRLEETLAELKAVQQQIIQQERLRGIGQMASGIAHNFNNALMPILGFSELLLNYPQTLDDKEKVTKYLQMMNTAAQGAAATVSRLRGFYRRQDAGEISQPVDLNSLVLQTIDLTQPKWKDEAQRNNININIETELHEIPLITGAEAELRDVLTNLIFNAVDAMPQGGTVTFRTHVDDDKSAVLEVCDMGVGMTEEARRHCLDPFFSTKGEHGAGLGLAVVYGAVQRHGGEIDIESELGVGTTIIIRVPVRS